MYIYIVFIAVGRPVTDNIYYQSRDIISAIFVTEQNAEDYMLRHIWSDILYISPWKVNN